MPKADFPSITLVKEVLRGRSLLHEFFKPGIFSAVEKELCIMAKAAVQSLSCYASETPLVLSTEGGQPTMGFATPLIQALRLKHGEDSVLQLFTSELRTYILERETPLPLKNGYELACANGELILRTETTIIPTLSLRHGVTRDFSQTAAA